jgi:hypothetical protein
MKVPAGHELQAPLEEYEPHGHAKTLGAGVGDREGFAVGSEVGFFVGDTVGATDEGFGVGDNVGRAVGSEMHVHESEDG